MNRRDTAGPLLFVAWLSFAVSTAGCASVAANQSSPWLRVGSEGRSLEIFPGTVEIAGTGALEFADGRRIILVPAGFAVRADGGSVSAGSVAGADAVRLTDADGSVRWTIRRVPEMPAGEGSRIRDQGRGSARVDAATPMRFFLSVDGAGRTEFFHPDRPPPGQGRDSPVSRVRRMLERYQGYGATGLVAFSRDGGTIQVAGAGSRDSAGRDPLERNTIFELGSLTKQLTAAAVLRLWERGLLAPSDSLGRFIDGLPEDVATITLHQMMTHTSGLPEDVDVPRDDIEAVRSELRRVKLDFAPGKEWSYSNFGFVVLAALVEQVSGEPYRRFVEHELLRPSGAGDIGFPSLHGWPASRFAVGASGPLGTARVTRYWPVQERGWNARLGASGAVASMPALHDWFRALVSGRVLSDSATARMFEEHDPEIAYGWFYMRSGTATAIAHGGDTEGTQTFLRYRPDLDLVIALGVNDRRGWRGPLLRDVITILEQDSMPDLPPAVTPVSPDSLDRLAGIYLMHRDTLTLTREGNGLRAAARGPHAVAMIAGADSAREAEMCDRSTEARAFLGALLAGDSATVSSELAEENRQDSFWRVWNALGEGHARKPTGFEILGTIPDRAGRIVTFAKIEFATGSETLRLVWRPHLAGWGTGGDTPSRVFRPVGSNRLVSYDPTLGEAVTLTVRQGAGGVVVRDAYGRVASSE